MIKLLNESTSEFYILMNKYKYYQTFNDIEASSGNIADLVSDLNASGTPYEVYEHKTDNGITVFYGSKTSKTRKDYIIQFSLIDHRSTPEFSEKHTRKVSAESESDAIKIIKSLYNTSTTDVRDIQVIKESQMISVIKEDDYRFPEPWDDLPDPFVEDDMSVLELSELNNILDALYDLLEDMEKHDMRSIDLSIYYNDAVNSHETLVFEEGPLDLTMPLIYTDPDIVNDKSSYKGSPRIISKLQIEDIYESLVGIYEDAEDERVYLSDQKPRKVPYLKYFSSYLQLS